MGVLFTPLAETDLEEIGDYIALDNPTRALSFIREIRAQCQKIGKSPLAYRARVELGDEIRSCPFGNYVPNPVDRANRLWGRCAAFAAAREMKPKMVATPLQSFPIAIELLRSSHRD